MSIRRTRKVINPQAHKHVEQLRKALGDDDAIEVLAGRSILFVGRKHQCVLRKAKHDGRQHPDTGRFVPMSHEPKTTKADGITWVHADDRRMIPWMLSGGKRVPSSGGDDNRQRAYSNEETPDVHLP
jgi:hypothetical protein